MKVRAGEKELLSDLASIGIACSTETAELRHYGRDWTTRDEPAPLALVRPRNTSEVKTTLQLCAKHQIPIVPSGGRTGLAGAAVAAAREVILTLEKLNEIADVDLLNQTVRVGAGAIHQLVQDRAAEHDLLWPVDLASKGSCQIGGNIATNAGGLRVIRYGHCRQWVQSVEVVLLSGEILELSGDVLKNNTGYDLKELFIGSEGTLGIITAATLRLTRREHHKALLLFAVSEMSNVLKLLEACRRNSSLHIQAFEWWTRACLEAVMKHRGFGEPFSAPANFYVLAEFSPDNSASDEELNEFLARVTADALVLDGQMANSAVQSENIWAYREGITESLAARGHVYKNDLALPLHSLADFTEELFALSPQWYGDFAELFIFGHIGDGNLHINVVARPGSDAATFFARAEGINDLLFALTQKYRGSIAAEHGIGLLKKRYLHYSRCETEIQIFRAIKRAFDPAGLLNPGKIFD